jgi:polyisoprenoid-binding protein YceI
MRIAAMSLLAAVYTFGDPQRALAEPMWRVDPAVSDLGFTLTIGGSQATGGFETWAAEIAYDPAKPERGRVAVTVDLSSVAIDSVPARQPMVGPDWLAVAEFPAATFEGSGFSIAADGGFALPGTLTLKGVARPMMLTGRLSIEGPVGTATMSGVIARADHGVGPPDPAVSMDVEITAHIVAHRIE